jgi:hypothetical protein
LSAEALILKLAAVVQLASMGASPRENHRFETRELPRLFEIVIVQLHELPAPPTVYRNQENEPSFDSDQKIRLVIGHSGAGKTTWLAHGAILSADPVVYIDAGEGFGPSLAAVVARELAARVLPQDDQEFRRAFMPGITPLESLRAVGIFLKQRNTIDVAVVLDNVQKVSVENLVGIVQSISNVRWILLAQPWPGLTLAEATLGIRAEMLSGWSTLTIGMELADQLCTASPLLCERFRKLTGGLPLFVRSGARLAREHFAGDVGRFCDDVESSVSLTVAPQQMILNRVLQGASDLGRQALLVLVVSDVALSKDEAIRLISISLSVSASDAASLVRELLAWGIAELRMDGYVAIHDSFRLGGTDAQRSIDSSKMRLARETLAAILFRSLKTKNLERFRLYCKLLPQIGKTKELVDVANSASEYF